MIDVAARHAFSDSILFENFELWNKKEIDDEDLLFQIRHFIETKDRPALPQDKRNLTNNTRAIETIKEDADQEFAKKFARKLDLLAISKKLDTNEKLGNFLDVSSEQARKLLLGDHKPQRKTLLKVSLAFRVPIEDFLED